MILVYKRLSQDTATKLHKDVMAFFASHPERNVCRTDLFKVRRGHEIEDILAECQDGVKLGEKSAKF